MELRPLGPVSPSHTTGLATCALREVWAAGRTPSLLPVTPAARLGTVAHRLLEEAGRGLLAGFTQDGIAARWDEILHGAEEAAARSWLDRHLLPLSAAIPDFEVRKLQALSRAHALAEEAASSQHAEGTGTRQVSGFEMAVATPDGKAGGRIDAVIPTAEGPVIRDYKSGAIYERGIDQAPAVKAEYVTQLKLYAAIYAAMTGRWPARLEVLPLVGEPEAIPFTPTDCTRLLAEAVELRDAINAIVESDEPTATKMQRLATPAPTACGYCPYRPQCAEYADAAAAEPTGWPLDVRGKIVEKQLLGNGRMMVSLEAGGTVTRVRGLDASPERHPAIHDSRVGDNLAAFNLRADGSPSSFSEGRFTVIYRIETPAGSDGDDS